MPLYEYKCLKCGKRVEKIEKVDPPHLKKCPTCGGPVERMASAPAIQFKGSGWYVNDYGKSSSAAGKSDKREGSSEKSEKSDKSDKSESKSAEKPAEKVSAGTKEKKSAAKEK